MVRKDSTDLPPGFRFHPTDEELIMYYLRNQATSRPCPVAIIPEIDLYKFDPWELPEKTVFGENEWYFFTPRDRKYPNGVRPNRAAVSGYWKATGTDKSIYSSSKYVGVKKALVFYKGRPPKGSKTDWIMHEYRLISESTSHQPIRQNGSMRLDDWVLCRIYKKKNQSKAIDMKVEDQQVENVEGNFVNEAFKIPRPYSLSQLWEMDCMGSISQLFGENSNSYNTTSFDDQNNIDNNNVPNGINVMPSTLGNEPNQYGDGSDFRLDQSSLLSRGSVYMNSVFELQ